ncbi:MAG: XRE family transcriptional regulator [Lachnospiraceae bacterium]|nr:XRE family transcriptional regulator [Lachnospiraceae bacterium]
MKTSDLVIQLLKKEKVSQKYIAGMLGKSPQSFCKRLKRDTLSVDELLQIADILDITFEQAFITKEGTRIELSNVKTGGQI